MSTSGVVRRVCRGGLWFVAQFLLTGAAWAASADLQVSSYTWAPDPVVHNGTATFTIVVQNNGPAASTGSTLVVNPLPRNLTFSSAPAGCSLGSSGADQTLTCTIGALAMNASSSVVFTGTGGTADVRTTTATITDNTIGNTDPNAANNALSKQVTSTLGADLTVTQSGPADATSGDTISFTLTAHNAGPDPASSFRVTDALPAAVDFDSVTATGSDWSCAVTVGTSAVCTYTGAAIAAGGSTGAITVQGRVLAGSGTITNGASIVTTDGSTGDPDETNNTAANVVVSITPGTALRANKAMTGLTLGETARFLSGENIRLRLSVTNQGPQAATDITLSDTVPAHFTIDGGSVPAGCSLLDQTITCTVASLASGATSGNFDFTLTAPTVVSNTVGSNTATVARVAPAAGSNTAATVNYTVVPPYAHLLISKSKGPSPVYAGTDITSTIRVRNDPASPAAATGTITVIDTLTSYPDELYQSVSGAEWNCVDTTASDKKVTCTYDIPATLAPGAYTPDLVIITRPAPTYTGGYLTNTAATGNTHSPGDNNPGLTSTVSVYGTDDKADLAVVINDPVPATVTTSDTGFSFDLVVSNNGPNNAGTATVTTSFPLYYSRNGTTGLSYTLNGGGFGAGEGCSYSGVTGNITCTLKNVVSGASHTIRVTAARPVQSGSFTLNASVSTFDTVDENSANNSDSTAVTVVPIADVTVSQIQAAQDPVKAGVSDLITVSIRNDGPNPAASVVVEIPVDTSKVELTSGPAVAGGSGTCLANQALTGGFAGQSGIRCTIASMPDNDSRQVSFQVMPMYSAYTSPGTYTVNARVETGTTESAGGNNTASRAISVIVPSLDLSVTLQEATGYSYGAYSGLLYDPVAYGDAVKYRVTIRNNGPSLATEVEMVQTPAPPGGYTMVYQSMSVDAGNSNYSPATAPSCSWDGTAATCLLGNSLANSLLPSGSYVALELTFLPGPAGNDPASSLTFANTALVRSAETLAAYDSQSGNNSVAENTTVLPRTDLEVAVAAVESGTTNPLPGAVNLNEPFDYLLTVKNFGASSASGVRVTDALPGGFARTADAITVTPGAGVTLTSNSCSGTTTITCDLGVIPADATEADSAKWVTIRIPVKAAYQSSGSYSFAFNTNIGNSATVEPLPNTSIDIDEDNNLASVNVQVQRSSISGKVFSDNNKDGDGDDANEPIGSVTLTLSGTDDYGNAIPNKTATTNASGVFLFDNLPPTAGTGAYQIVETQPANTYDYLETAGTAAGSVPGACDGTNNCVNTAAANTISAIKLPENTAASGYLFQDYRRATVSGTVYHDADNDGVKDAGETTVVSGVTVQVQGTGYNGLVVTVSGTTNASGLYTLYAPPSDGSGYNVVETQPATYLDGLEYSGTARINGSAGGPDTIALGVVAPNGTYSNRHFGELRASSLAGNVFLDGDGDGTRDAGENSGVFGLTITLTGTDDLGTPVNTTTTTGAAGAYSFSGLRPGTYALAESAPAGLDRTGSQVGSLGGTAGVRTITAITVVSNSSGTNYNFGESGQGLSGYVYVDVDRDGARDGGEPGIEAVQITLSGLTSGGEDVCDVISPDPCTLSTNAAGYYEFADLPASDGTGYTLTQQSQASGKLVDYGNGAVGAGTINGATVGTASTTDISAIVLPAGQTGIEYNFGEYGAELSGSVIDESNANAGLAGVTIALSGTTGAGDDVCTRIASCSTTTAADGTFSLKALPRGSYTLTETQPFDYTDGTNTVGSAGGAAGLAGSDTTFSAINLGVGASGSGYGFGEELGSLTGLVCVDTDNDTVCDAGETGLQGVQITLSGTSASGVAVNTSATTDATGAFSFGNVRRADASGYTLTEQAQTLAPLDAYIDGNLGIDSDCGAGKCTGDTNSPNRITAIDFDPAKSYSFVFGELQPASLAGHVYLDTNANGVKDAGETAGIPGVAVTLTGTDDRGAVNRSVNTDANGAFSFGALRPGTYVLTEANAGFTATASQPGSLGGTAGARTITAIPVASNSAGTGYNFGEGATGGLSGKVYVDVNGNNSFDAGDAGIADVSVALSGTTAGGQNVCTVIAPASCTITTDASGAYAFSGLPASNGAGYTLTQQSQASAPLSDYGNGGVQAGTRGGTAASAPDRVSAIVLAAGQSGTGYNFGEEGSVLSGSVTDEGSAGGIAGVTLTLSGTTGAGADLCTRIANCTTTTAADGTFSFRAVPAGSYTLTETQPVDYAEGSNSAGSAGGSAGLAGGDTRFTGITLTAGNDGTGYSFGEYLGSITGTVCSDADNDGACEAGEQGIAGVSMTLTGTSASGLAVNATVTTGAAGAYAFSGVRRANGSGYTLREQAQTSAPLSSYLDSKVTAAGDCTTCVIAASSPNTVSAIDFDPADSYSFTFGELEPISLAGHVYLDQDGDGTRDAGETAGINGLTITLTGADDRGAVNLTTTTGAGGAYSFANLRPGSYALAEATPAGLVATAATAGSLGGTPGTRTITAITAVAGDAGTGYNFGEAGRGLSGYVYVDLNANNGFDPGVDAPIEGVGITLSGNTQGGLDVCGVISPNPCTVTTGSDGRYAFADLPASDATGYTLTQQAQTAAPLVDYGNGAVTVGKISGHPVGSAAASPDRVSGIVLATDAGGAGYNFGETGGTLSGSVTDELNATGIAGVTITLSGTTGSGDDVCTRIASCTATTAAGGGFSFAALPAGSYTLTQTQPVDYAEGTNAAGLAGGVAGLTGSNTTFSGIALAAGATGSGYLFGEHLGTISGRVCVDADNNGVCAAGEAGIEGVTMSLAGISAGGVNMCASGCPSSVTDATGAFSFSNVRRADAGGYTVEQQDQATAPLDTYFDGKVGVGANCAGCTAVATSPNRITGIDFDPALAYSFAFGELSAASLAGTVYDDRDGDVNPDDGEGLAGVTVTLTGTDDEGTVVNRTTTTDAAGGYRFNLLRPSATGYTLTETQPTGVAEVGVDVGSLGGTAGLNTITGIVTAQAETGTGYDFRDDAGVLAGRVYLDADRDGLLDGGETGLAGVTVTLTGTDADLNPVNRATVSGADGSYAFTGLLAGTYVLTETAPVIYEPGNDTVGSAGGALNGTSEINGIVLGAGVDGTGYLFAEQPGNNATVSGAVWFNSESPDDLRQAGEPGLADWRVEAWRAGALVSSATTDANGEYTLNGLAPNYGYELKFRHPVNNAIFGQPISTEPGVDLSGSTIANLTVGSGATIVNQSLPLDPSGVVYDAVTRNTLAGATVSITGPAGFDPALHLVGGSANQSQLTDDTGYYQFLLLAGAPAGTYTLSVTAPGGYLDGPSAILPPQNGPLAVGPLPNPNLISPDNEPPAVGTAAVYYLSFGLSAASANVLNNHIPVDPVLEGAIVMTKSAGKLTVSRGELVPYTLTARNTLSAVLPNIAIHDQMPPGFKYVKGSATIDGVAAEPTVAGRDLSWSGLSFTAGQTRQVQLLLVIGAGVNDGDYVNRTWSMNTVANARVSNVADATVRVVPDPTFECTDLIGKVFDDRNRNGYADAGEPGLPGVRVATAKGWLVTTDAEGRYHIACAQTPDELNGANFILKLDERTLPSGYRVTTENPRVVRLTQGKLAKLNFGAAIHRVVRLDLDARAFGERGELDAAYAERIAGVLALLHQEPSVLRVAYHLAAGEDEVTARKRLARLHEVIEQRWTPQGCCYDLLIEDEVVSRNGNGEVAQ